MVSRAGLIAGTCLATLVLALTFLVVTQVAPLPASVAPLAPEAPGASVVYLAPPATPSFASPAAATPPTITVRQVVPGAGGEQGDNEGNDNGD